MSVNVNASYRGDQNQSVHVQSRTLVNAQVSYSNENFGAYLVATNMFDDRYYDYQYRNAGRLQVLLREPRAIGLIFEARF